MYKILVTGSIHKIGLEMLRKEKDIEIHFAPDLPYAEILKIITPFCVLRLTGKCYWILFGN